MNALSTIGVVAGSGLELEPTLDTVTRDRPFSEIEGLPDTKVSGHSGRLIEGTCNGIRVALQCGRLHLYEGLDYVTATRTVDVMHALGVRTIIFTNAAGGLRPDMNPGDLMTADRLTLWPYAPWSNRPESIAPDVLLDGCDFQGTYTWMHGPCYETRAEIAALRALKSDAVGMSTAPEMARCAELGIRTAAISCITNNCTRPRVLTHEHVMQTAKATSARLCALLRDSIRSLAAQEQASA